MIHDAFLRACVIAFVVGMIVVLGLVVSILAASAQEGMQGHGHDHWHESFYRNLTRPKPFAGSCCNMADCRPTSLRTVDDHYEVKVDGVWTRVPPNTILHIMAPDGGAHVCAPPQQPPFAGVIYCVVLPPEG